MSYLKLNIHPIYGELINGGNVNGNFILEFSNFDIHYAWPKKNECQPNRRTRKCQCVWGYRVIFWTWCRKVYIHDDDIKWKHFPRYWPFVRGIHRSTVKRSFVVFFDLRLNERLSKQLRRRYLRRHRTHYDVIVLCNANLDISSSKHSGWRQAVLDWTDGIYIYERTRYTLFHVNKSKSRYYFRKNTSKHNEMHVCTIKCNFCIIRRLSEKLETPRAHRLQDGYRCACGGWALSACSEYFFLLMMKSSNGNIFRVTGHLCEEFTDPRWIPAQRPVTRSFDVFFELRLNKRLSKQSWGWWFETLPPPLWRHCNVIQSIMFYNFWSTAVYNLCNASKYHQPYTGNE